MSALANYATYRESGAEWIREVPSDWQMRKLGTIFELKRREVSSDDEVVTAFRDGCVTLRRNRRGEGFTQADKEIGYQGVRKGDLVIHNMDGFAGAIGVADSSGKSTPVYSVTTPRMGDNPEYFAHLLRHMARVGYITSLARGIRERSTDFRWAAARDILVTVPDESTQSAIVRFLRRETAAIDAFIADQEKLIALLAERRAATISHAVTRGLEMSGRTRDSGTTWLGRIAEDWSLTRARFLCRIGTGSGDTIDSTMDGNYPFYVRSGAPLRSPVFEFDTEAVLTAGDGAGVGKVFHLVSGPFHAHQRVYVLSQFRVVTAKYFYYFFSAMFAKVALDGSARSTVDSVRRSMIADLPVSHPDKGMQEKITDYLDRETAELDAAIADAREAIALSKERRAALVSAAVTGKIDVRGAV